MEWRKGDRTMKLLNILIIGVSLILIAGIVIAQAGINFPSTFTMNLNELPSRQSAEQRFYGCPYDQNLEHRVTGIKEISWNGTRPTVIAEVQYWTQDRKCAGSKKLTLTLAPSSSAGQLVANFISGVNSEFTAEANLNRQPRQPTSGFISTGSSG